MDKQPGAAGDVEHITGSAIERRQDWTGSGGSSPADAGGLTPGEIDNAIELALCLAPAREAMGVARVLERCKSLLATEAAQPSNADLVELLEAAVSRGHTTMWQRKRREVLASIGASPAPSANPDLDEVEARIAQAKADLMPRREAFIKYAKSRALATIERVDDWGARTFIDTVVQAMWEAWFSALESAAAPSASASSAAPGLTKAWIDENLHSYFSYSGHNDNIMWASLEDIALFAQAAGKQALAASPAAAVAAPTPEPVAGSQQAPEEVGGVNLARLLRNLEETSYNEGSIDLACRCSDSLTVIKGLLAAAAPAVPVPVAQAQPTNNSEGE